MSLLLPSKERSSLIRFIGFDLRVRCTITHLLLTTSNAIISVLGGASAFWYNLRSYIGGRRKGERERLLYRRVSKSCHYAIAYEIEQSTSFINVSPPPVVSYCYGCHVVDEFPERDGKEWNLFSVIDDNSLVLKWEDVEIEESKEGKVAKLMTVKDVVLKLNPLFTKNKLLVSVAAGVKLHDLQVGSCVEIRIPLLILFIALSQVQFKSRQ
ncbi:hypothetical protein AHAS_Ahas20G0169000 [Arachis hypogaea]